jgi:uncharacterized protein YdeI (YjbR/CyaY-like superfamily)
MSIEMQMLHTRNRSAWRRWLEKHHDSSRGIWLEFYKKHTGKPSITYSEALEEALCFGWIDSIVKRIDDERYMQKFTPRTNPQKWSAINLRHMQRLISEGRMTEAGLRVLEVPLDQAETEIANEDAHKKPVAKKQEPVPDFIKSAIAGNPMAAEFWRKLAPGYRRRYLAWILHAKGETTRSRRLSEVVRYLAAGTKSILK